MTAQAIAPTRIRPWVLGVLLSAAAMFLGWPFGSAAADLLGGEPGTWARIGKGFVWGLIIGGLQWPIVRTAGVRSAGFLAASAAGLAAGYLLGQNVPAVAVGDLNWRFVYGAALAVYGLSLGIPQWLLLRRHMQRASLWILFSVVAWLLAGLAWISFGVHTGPDALVYGVVTGLGLVWLARPEGAGAGIAKAAGGGA